MAQAFCSVAKLCPTLQPHGLQHASLSSSSPSSSLLKLMFIKSVIPSNHLILCHHLLFCSQSFPASGSFSVSQLFTSRWPKYWSFSFNISPSNEYSGLISFRMDCLDLLAVQGTLKSLLQHHSSKAPILRCLAFFIASNKYLLFEICPLIIGR